MAYLLDKESGLLYRENTMDKFVIDEQSTYSKLLPYCKNAIVLDLGGNIGAFANEAEKAEAKHVISFEPDPENFDLLKRQYLPKTTVYNQAVAPKTGTTAFYVNPNSNKGRHTMYKNVKGRNEIQVRTMSFSEVLEIAKPDVIKMDIEGGEFTLDLDLILETEVEAMAIEIHPILDKIEAVRVYEWMQKHFNQLNRTTLTDKTKAMLFIGERK